ncbi:malonate decarboxylase holo-[acyl-carrier-protein] synthase [Rugamonas sp. CCM 8940]|uniref:malonate decarboxylase holo-[acyl-carrier-protein] synthase n=1 Tax=Rugamonas sp. CCM 8940 TaxID=2765359 RepID=UPI0018F4CE04|nr:malonate decarboxylase holo-[acyl-carrier-protein] synthase [Rugamonas sp. CCM 8940]MBJ7312637.1 malonate decarboxylase holo-[acyl-carrier-protein] synthase [Rugamonas sp. CCM 8940]
MYARHSLVWLSARGWQATIAAAAPEHAGALQQWQRAGHPSIVRRRDADAGADQICLGVALPPEAGGRKPRIALRVDAAEVARHWAPLPLAALLDMPALPAVWQAALAALLDDAHDAGIELRVYGSVALQVLTGLAYLRAGSDIDILFQPASTAQLHDGVALLARHAAYLPLDGEIVFPSAQAVAWKEWYAADAGQARVLAKLADGVRLATRDELCAALEPA